MLSEDGFLEIMDRVYDDALAHAPPFDAGLFGHESVYAKRTRSGHETTSDLERIPANVVCDLYSLYADAFQAVYYALRLYYSGGGERRYFKS